MGNEEVLNSIQQVLRGLAICLALEQKSDMARLSSALEAFAANPALTETARAMLADLAVGLSVMGAARATKN